MVGRWVDELAVGIEGDGVTVEVISTHDSLVA